MIKNIVFDMGNVLVSYDIQRYIGAHVPDPEDGVLLTRSLFRSVEWIQMDRGVLTQREAEERVCKRLPERLHPTVRVLLDSWHQDIPPLPGMEALVGRLKDAGYRIYLLSNTSARYHEFRRNIGALRYFDGEFISADWGLLKPEVAIYRAFCQHFGLTPGQCFFVDDMPVNIEGARVAGMRGTVYHDDIELLTEEMRDAGINI